MPPENIEQAPLPSSKKTLWSLIILVLIGIGGWASYAYYSQNALTPEELIMAANQNFLDLESGNLDVTMSVDFKDIAKEDPESNKFFLGFGMTEVAFTLKGSYDTRDLENPKYDFDIEAGSGMLSIAGGLRVIDKMGYLRVGKIPAIAEEMAGQFTDKWFSFPIEGEELEESLRGFTEAEKEFIYDTALNDQSFKILEELAPETVNGDLSRHFSFGMDRVALKACIIKIGEYLNTTRQGEDGEPYFDTVAFDKEFEAVRKIDGSIWISKGDNYMNKMILNLELAPDPKKSEVVRINFAGTFGGFNKPVRIVAPTETTPFEEVFGDMFAPMDGEIDLELK